MTTICTDDEVMFTGARRYNPDLRGARSDISKRAGASGMK
jgi:hypothetical protein